MRVFCSSCLCFKLWKKVYFFTDIFTYCYFLNAKIMNSLKVHPEFWSSTQRDR